MNNSDLETYIGSLGWMFQDVETIVSSGWNLLFDIDNCPELALPWLAQIVGVQLENESIAEDHDAYVLRQRQNIKNANGQHRGTVAAMIGALLPYLIGNKTVFFRERDGDAYTVTVVTRTSETPNQAAALRALLTQKPAGLILNYVVVTGRTFAETTALNQTFATSQTTWPLFSNRRGA